MGRREAYIKSTKLPAIKALLKLSDSYNDAEAIASLIAKRGRISRKEALELIYGDTGIVNLYAAFRNISKQWIEINLKKISPLIRKAINLESDVYARELCAKVLILSPIEQPKTGNGLPAINLLSPLIACLDPMAKYPILNKRAIQLLGAIGMGSHDRLSQHLNLVRLIKLLNCNDAFELDVLLQFSNKGQLAKIKHIAAQYKIKPLVLRKEEDIIALQLHQTVKKRNLHNKMTNRLVAMLGGQCSQGPDRNAMWDVLITGGNYSSTNLLLEVKSVVDIPSARMAVGQLLDYRRYFANPAKIKLAVLFPEKPLKSILDYLSSVRIDCFWFTNKRLEKIRSPKGIIWH